MSIFDRPLYHHISKLSNRKPKGDIGIELEVEGLIDGYTYEYWNVIEENSLRGGREFVLNRPIPYTEVDSALEEWEKGNQQSKLWHSIRTSTHVHINVRDFTLRQVYNIIAAYFLVENVLVRLNGPEREGNLFCLRVCDAEDLLYSLISQIESGQFLNGLHPDHYKYAAINLAALNKFGSLEFRFMRGFTKAEDIKLWTKALYNFVSTVKDFDSTKLISLANSFNGRLIIKELFPSTFAKYVFTQLSDEEITNLCIENYCYAYRLLTAVADVANSTYTQKPIIVNRSEDLPDSHQPPESVGLSTIEVPYYNPIPGNIEPLEDFLFDDPDPED